jgi:hypothetical protein
MTVYKYGVPIDFSDLPNLFALKAHARLAFLDPLDCLNPNRIGIFRSCPGKFSYSLLCGEIDETLCSSSIPECHDLRGINPYRLCSDR